jgi:hypothetical protein
MSDEVQSYFVREKGHDAWDEVYPYWARGFLKDPAVTYGDLILQWWGVSNRTRTNPNRRKLHITKQRGPGPAWDSTATEVSAGDAIVRREPMYLTYEAIDDALPILEVAARRPYIDAKPDSLVGGRRTRRHQRGSRAKTRRSRSRSGKKSRSKSKRARRRTRSAHSRR